jgi:SAM-dependent methyltransferase/predicted  nucleic acid-binding Zn-ribbon protein
MTDRFDPDAALTEWLRRLPQYQYVAELVSGKRVLEVQCGTGYGAQYLAGLGAARVVGTDKSAGAIGEARDQHRLTNLEFRIADPASLELEDASFDIVFVPDGAQLLRRAPVLDELRRVLARDGCLVFSATSADRPSARGGASFFELQDRLGAQFAPVRMVALSPFVGMSLAEYGDAPVDDQAIDLDTTLAGLSAHPDDDVTDYVAVCGPSVDLRGRFTVVQVPSVAGASAVAEALGVAKPASPAEVAAPPRAGSRELDDARARLRDAVDERDRLAKRIEDAQQETGRVAAEAGIELSKARSDLAAMRTRVLELEATIASQAATSQLPAAVREAVGTALADEFDGGQLTVQDRIEEVLDSQVEAELEEEVAAGTDGAPSVSEMIAEALESHAQDMADLEAIIDERSAYADELREEREQAVAEAERLTAAFAALEQRIQERERALLDWRTRAARAEGELLARDMAAPDDTAVRALRASLAAAQTEAAGLREQLEERTDELAGERELALTYHDSADDTKRKLADAAAELAAAEAARADADTARAVAEEQLEAAAEKLSDIRRELAMAHTELGLARSGGRGGGDSAVTPETSARVRKLESDLAEARKQLAIAHTELSLAQKRGGGGLAEAIAGAGARAVVAELENARREIEQLRAQLDRVPRQKTNGRDEQIRRILNEIASAREEMSGRSAAEILALMDDLRARLDRG